MAKKHIFIGIGGQGVKTVSKIKAKIYEKRFPEATASKSRLQAMNDDYRFIFIDTDQRDIDEANRENRESFEHGNVPFINPATDLINLGRANPSAIYYEAKKDQDTLINKRIVEACSQELANMIPDQPLSFGAGAFRIKSRIAFAHSLADFQSKVRAAITSLNDVKSVGGEDCIIYYWLISSSLGGTGSGILNDVLYHINQLHRQIVGTGDPQLVYTMYMPKAFIDANATEEKYSLNAYGVFSELDAFKKMSHVESQKTVMHRLAFNNDYNLVDASQPYSPFYYMIPVDIQTDKGTSLGNTDKMVQNTAEMLYHMHSGQAGDTFRSDLDNYMNDHMNQAPEEYLVPMGYVSLQKPQEQFSKYMRARFRRDVLRSLLVCNDKSQAAVKKEEIEPLYKKLFYQLMPESDECFAANFANSITEIQDDISSAMMNDKEELLDGRLYFSAVDLSGLDANIADAMSDDKRTMYKEVIRDNMWKVAERLVLEHGLAYTQDAIEKVRKYMAQKCQAYRDGGKADRYDELAALEAQVQELANKAQVNTWIENIAKSNHKQIQDYLPKLNEYVELYKDIKIEEWANDLMKDFCMDDKNDELSKLARHLQSIQIKAEDKNNDAVKTYNRLAVKFGETSMDVTSVYLPMLKKICDGNGWKPGNFFSKLYNNIVKAEDNEQETPVRSDLQRIVEKQVYGTTDDELINAAYKVKKKTLASNANDDDDAKDTYQVQFFANPVISDRGNVSAEKIIDDFLNVCETVFLRALRSNQVIQENWYNRKISQFFSDLTNDEKDEVRRALNPALFFSYNNNRIDVTKKEDRLIFTAANQDLAEEMLGYQNGNNRHRFVSDDNEDRALIVKYKFGLSLKDYRPYDAIKMVYDKATFREKYHFHRDFAQHLDKLTLDNLPYEVLAQHRSFVKMLLLETMRDDLAPLFYKDKFEKDDEQTYTNTMYLSEYPDSFSIALPEAFITDPHLTEGKLALRKEADGRKLYVDIEAKSFIERFAVYMDKYHNSRFGETLERLIQAILRITVSDENVTYKGEGILKRIYPERREQLLARLNEQKRLATSAEEKRLLGIFFNILREEYATVNDFKK